MILRGLNYVNTVYHEILRQETFTVLQQFFYSIENIHDSEESSYHMEGNFGGRKLHQIHCKNVIGRRKFSEFCPQTKNYDNFVMLSSITQA